MEENERGVGGVCETWSMSCVGCFSPSGKIENLSKRQNTNGKKENMEY